MVGGDTEGEWSGTIGAQDPSGIPKHLTARPHSSAESVYPTATGLQVGEQLVSLVRDGERCLASSADAVIGSRGEWSLSHAYAPQPIWLWPAARGVEAANTASMALFMTAARRAVDIVRPVAREPMLSIASKVAHRVMKGITLRHPAASDAPATVAAAATAKENGLHIMEEVALAIVTKAISEAIAQAK